MAAGLHRPERATKVHMHDVVVVDVLDVLEVRIAQDGGVVHDSVDAGPGTDVSMCGRNRS
jgi:hypothetical protein